jgi:glutathione S-transferase
MLKILGRNNSSNVQKVVWVCAEMDVEFDRQDYGGAFGLVNDPEYMKMNPNSRVPTIIDDGFMLWESNAIVRYLSAKHGMSSMFPSDPIQFADADRWMDWQQTTVGPAIFPVFWGLVRTPEAERDLAAIDKGRLHMISVMQILEDRLEGREFLVGNRLSMADIPHGMMVHRWLTLVSDRPKMANLEAYYDRLCARPAFKEHVVDIPMT